MTRIAHLADWRKGLPETGMRGHGEPISRLDYALKLAAAGFYIFPLARGTKDGQIMASWPKSMTSDAATIREWFRLYPDCNYGVCPGQKFVVLDPDQKDGKDGLAVLSELELVEAPGDKILGRTLTVRTPSGGRHLYLRVPHTMSNARFADDIDTRGGGGYVVGPGCELIAGLCGPKDTAGHYTVEHDVAVMDAPAWVLQRLTQRRQKDPRHGEEPEGGWDHPGDYERAKDKLRHIEPARTGENGNQHTYNTACELSDWRLSQAATLRLLDEPWKDGLAWSRDWSGDRSTLEAVIARAYRYCENAAGCKAERDDEHKERHAEAGQLHDKVRAEAGLAHVRDSNQSDIPGVAPNTLEPSNRWFGYTIAQAQTELPQAEMTVDQWFIARGYTALLAKRGTGKTVVMLDLALSLAHDRAWQRKATKTGLMAIYLCGEDKEGARDHAAAWCANQNGDTKNPRFLFVPDLPDLMNEAECKDCAEHLKPQIPEGMRAVLFFDTFNRGAQRGKQKDDDAMNEATRNLETVLGGGISAKGILAAFHPPKGDATTILGSTVIEGNSVGIWQMEKDDATNIRTLTVTRLKAKGENNSLSVNWVSQEIPGQFDDFGNAATGAVAVHQSGEDTARLQDAARKAARAALAPLIVGVVDQHPERTPSMADIHKALAGQTYTVDGKPRQFPRGVTQAREKLAELYERNPYEIEPDRWLVLYQAEKNAKRFGVCNFGYVEFLRQATKPPKL